MKKYLIYLLLFYIVEAQNDWRKVHGARQYSISGVAKFEKGFLVVHDNKKKNQPRISYLDNSLRLRKLIWPEPLLPYDLEALHKMPGFKKYFAGPGFWGGPKICSKIRETFLGWVDKSFTKSNILPY